MQNKINDIIVTFNCVKLLQTLNKSASHLTLGGPSRELQTEVVRRSRWRSTGRRVWWPSPGPWRGTPAAPPASQDHFDWRIPVWENFDVKMNVVPGCKKYLEAYFKFVEMITNKLDLNAMQPCTPLLTCMRHSSQGSAMSSGRASLLMSATLISTMDSWKRDHLVREQ